MVEGTQSDVVIDIGGNIENLKIALAKARKELRKGVKDSKEVAALNENLVELQRNLSGARMKGLGLPSGFDKGFKSSNDYLSNTIDTTKELSAVARKASNDFGKITKMSASPTFGLPKDFNKKFASSNDYLLKTVDTTKELSNATKRTTKQLADSAARIKAQTKTPPFAGWALSIMFFGMALKNTFNTIWKSSTKTFNDVMHSTEGTVTGFDRLTGSMTYLGFTVGQALEPITEFLIPIIDKVSEFVSENEKLSAGLLVTMGVLGTLTFAGGFLVLAVNGFAELATKIGLAKTNADGLTSINWEETGKKIKQGIGIIAIGFAVEEAADAFKNFENGEIFKGLISALSAGAVGIGGLRMLKGKKGGGHLIAIGVALDLVEEGKFFETVTSVLGFLTAGIITFIEYMKYLFKNGFKNALVEGISFALDRLSGGLLTLIGGDKFKEELKGMMGADTIDSFDWGSAYKQAYNDSISVAKQYDSIINDFMSSDGFDVKTKSNYTPSVNNYGDNIYIDGIKIEPLPNENWADAVNRYFRANY